jgi:hypothetical protein
VQARLLETQALLLLPPPPLSPPPLSPPPRVNSSAQLNMLPQVGVQVHLYPVTGSPEPGGASPFWPSADACHDGSPGYEASTPPPLFVLPGWLAGWLAGWLQQQEQSILSKKSRLPTTTLAMPSC